MNYLGSFFLLNACQHHEMNLPTFYLPLLPVHTPMGRCQKSLHCRFHAESTSRVMFEHSFFSNFSLPI
jgi:hypothetical protein